jgi:hypothetical protein
VDKKKFLPRNICIGAIEQSLYNNYYTIFLKHLVMNMDQLYGFTRFLLMVHKQTWEKMGYPWNKKTISK